MTESYDPLTAKLIRHPESPGLGVMVLEATAVRSAKRDVILTYTVTGALHGLKIATPRDGPGQREEGLWRHTCLELFAKSPDEPAYREFNFSPSGAWQAYAFRTYREGGALPADALADRVPHISCSQTPTQMVMQVTLPAAMLPAGPLMLGLSAVIESRDGRLAYWALRHPKPKPDFHDAHAFILELP
jgi:hypothetical protein